MKAEHHGSITSQDRSQGINRSQFNRGRGHDRGRGRDGGQRRGRSSRRGWSSNNNLNNFNKNQKRTQSSTQGRGRGNYNSRYDKSQVECYNFYNLVIITSNVELQITKSKRRLIIPSKSPRKVKHYY